MQFNFLRDYGSADALAERGIADDEEDDRTLVEVLIEQVEFCDVIVVNKADLVSADALARLQRILHALNPRAVLIDAPLRRRAARRGAEHGTASISTKRRARRAGSHDAA